MTNRHTLHRRDDPDTSVAAAYSVDAESWEQKVYAFIVSCGETGGTPKEALDRFGYLDGRVPYSTVTARFRALKDSGLIHDTGLRRDRSVVYRTTRNNV